MHNILYIYILLLVFFFLPSSFPRLPPRFVTLALFILRALTALNFLYVGIIIVQTALAEVTVARVRDLGTNDTQFMTRTHLGNILQVGDNVWGFDVQSGNINDEHANRLNLSNLPDVVSTLPLYERCDPFVCSRLLRARVRKRDAYFPTR